MRPSIQSFLFVPSAVCFALAITSLAPNNSVRANSSAKDRGAELFATRGCAHCHGAGGVGGGRGPDLQLVRKRLKPAQITRQIHDGGQVMPPYGEQLSSAQIDDLVAYLSAKRKVIVVTRPIPDAPKPDAPTKEPD